MVAQRYIHTLITMPSKAEKIAKQTKEDETEAQVHILKDEKWCHRCLKTHA